MYEYLKCEFNRLGCNNPKIIAISTQVYLDLCEVKKYWDVEYLYDQKIDKIYFSAKTTKSADPTLFIPVEVSESLSFNDLQNLLQLSKNEKLYIAIVSSDSTSVYYQISKDVAEPCQEKKDVLERSRRIDAELRRNRVIIEQAALFNLPVTLKKESSEASTSGANK